MTSELVIREVFSDEAFVKGLFAMETPQEVQAALKEKKIELSIDEIVKTRELLVKSAENGGILSDEELQEVSGGFVVSGAVIIGIAGILAGIGIVIGAGVAGAAWGTDAATGGQW
jgi:hypothetical protein